MRAILLVLVVATGLLCGAFVYQQAIVEGSLGPAALIVLAVLVVAFLSTLTLYILAGTRHREVVGKIFLASASAIIAYGVIDLVAGWALIRPLSPQLVRDPVRHHRLVPNSHSEFHSRDFEYLQRENNLGLRGRDTPQQKPAGTWRILMLGDSFTMGKGVQDDETFSMLVEGALQPAVAACGGPRIEVLNGGVDSYAPVLSYLQLKTDLRPLDADLVILNLDVSDLTQEAAYRRQAVFGPDGDVLAVPQTGRDTPYERFRTWTSQHLFFTRVALVYANRAFNYGALTVRQVVNEVGRENFAHTLEGDVDRTAQWEQLFESLRRIKEIAAADSMDFVLTTYPWAHQLGDKDWVPGRYEFMSKDEKTTDLSAIAIREGAAANGIELVDLFPAFRAYDGSDPLYFKNDPHWTTAGHRVVAGALERYLLERYLPTWCGRGTARPGAPSRGTITP